MKMFVVARMTKHPVSVTSDATIQQADRLMKKHKFHRMIVVDNEIYSYYQNNKFKKLKLLYSLLAR